MIVDFFRRGTGNAAGPINYLLGKNQDREHAKILEGDPQEIADLIDCSSYTKKYTAGCLSFYESDFSLEEKKLIMKRFEETLFPGLNPDSYKILWVEHRDKINEETNERRLELNFLIPNIEINTGKRLQPFFAKADLDRVDCFKRMINYEFNCHDPDDPLNRQATKSAKSLPKQSKDLKKSLDIEVGLAIGEGLIHDRSTLVSWLKNIGLDVTRQTNSSVSIKNPNSTDENARPIRLSGEFYEQNFRHSQESAGIKKRASEEYRQYSSARNREIGNKFRELCETKSEYLQTKFGRSDRATRADNINKFEIENRANTHRDYESTANLGPAARAKGREHFHADQSARRELESRFKGIERPHRTQENSDYSEFEQSRGESSEGDKRDEQRATDANHSNEKGLAEIERIKSGSSVTSEAEKSPFFIEFDTNFSVNYFAYCDHRSWLRQQEQVQRNNNDQATATVRTSEIERNTECTHIEQRSVFQEIPYDERELKNEHARQSVIENFRRATEATQRTINDHQKLSESYARARTENQYLREKFDRNAKPSGAISRDFEQDFENSNFRSSLKRLANSCANACAERIQDVFRSVCKWFTDRRANSMEHNRTIERSNQTAFEYFFKRENENRATASGIYAINTEIIDSALSQMKVKKTQQLQQKNGRDYDSPSPF